MNYLKNIEITNKKLVMFDLDKTLARSKSEVLPEMIELLQKLLSNYYVVVISGGDIPQFKIQLVEKFPSDADLRNLHLLPTSGTKYFNFQNNELTEQYAENFSEDEIQKIYKALNESLKESKIEIPNIWGEQIENRGTQVTMSVLGQQAPVEAKEEWDPTNEKKLKIKELTQSKLGDQFLVNTGGATSIDVTYPGRDKGYGAKKISELLNLKLDEFLFIADNLQEGGNDYPVKVLGVDSIQTTGPDETKEIISEILQKTQ